MAAGHYPVNSFCTNTGRSVSGFLIQDRTKARRNRQTVVKYIGDRQELGRGWHLKIWKRPFNGTLHLVRFF